MQSRAYRVGECSLKMCLFFPCRYFSVAAVRLTGTIYWQPTLKVSCLLMTLATVSRAGEIAISPCLRRQGTRAERSTTMRNWIRE